MNRKIFLTSLLALASFASWSQTLSVPQLQTLKTAIAVQTDPVFVSYRNNGQTSLMVNYFNAPSTFVVWKTSVPRNEVGKTFVATGLDAITAGNNDKLANFAAWNDTVNPSRPDQRAFFDQIFSVAAGASTRAALLVLWKRAATRAEALYATGTGTDALPGLLTFEGAISDADISAALGQ